MPDIPEIRQFITLTSEDFVRYPIWVHCHSIDFDAEWYDQTDEETFRPWTGTRPVDPSDWMFLIRADFELADGTQLSGFITPSETDEIRGVHPVLFTANSQQIPFWLGMFPRPEDRSGAYQALGKTALQVFPIRFSAQPELSAGVISGTLEGFYSIPNGLDGEVRVEI